MNSNEFVHMQQQEIKRIKEFMLEKIRHNYSLKDSVNATTTNGSLASSELLEDVEEEKNDLRQANTRISVAVRRSISRAKKTYRESTTNDGEGAHVDDVAVEGDGGVVGVANLGHLAGITDLNRAESKGEDGQTESLKTKYGKIINL